MEKVNHPSHYNQVPNIECIDVIEHFNLNRGNAIKYIWRAGHKDDEITDLKKAIWYLEREITRIEKEESPLTTELIKINSVFFDKDNIEKYCCGICDKELQSIDDICNCRDITG